MVKVPEEVLRNGIGVYTDRADKSRHYSSYSFWKKKL